MIPLLWIFIAWIVVVGLFGLASLLTLATTVRYGLSCSSTYLSAGLFVAVSIGVIVLTVGYAGSVDLTQPFSLLSLF